MGPSNSLSNINKHLLIIFFIKTALITIEKNVPEATWLEYTIFQ